MKRRMKSSDKSTVIDPGVTIGHVHLKVADLERALAFYCGVLGFQLTQRSGRQRRVLYRPSIPSSHRIEHLGKSRRAAASYRARPGFTTCAIALSDTHGARQCAAPRARGGHRIGRRVRSPASSQGL